MMVSFETAGGQNAAQALEAALRMQDEFHAIMEEWQRLGYALDGLDNRIGIASGPVYGRRMGYGASSAFTIMGQPVNLAAHLCEHARGPRLCILISEATHSQLGQDSRARHTLHRVDVPHHVAYQVSRSGRPSEYTDFPRPSH